MGLLKFLKKYYNLAKESPGGGMADARASRAREATRGSSTLPSGTT